MNSSILNNSAQYFEGRSWGILSLRQPTVHLMRTRSAVIGNAMPGSKVIVCDSHGELLGSTVCHPDGSYLIALQRPIPYGESIGSVVCIVL